MASNAVDLLTLAIQANVPALAWGEPGIGKTSTIYQLAEQLNAHLEVVLVSIREPTDFGGLPVRGPEGVQLYAPGWAQRTAKANAEGQVSIVFFDEVNTGAPATQAAMLRVVFDKAVGDLDLVGANPDLVRFLAAANPSDQAAGGWELAPSLANRWFHFDWKLDSKLWAHSYLNNWPQPKIKKLPANWMDYVEQQKALTAGYIEAQPNKLLVVPKEDQEAGKAWASPRTYEMMDRMLGAAESVGMESLKLDIMKGSIGNVGKEYYTFLRDLDLPKPEALLNDPENFVLPGRGDQVYATLTAVVYAVINGNKKPDRYISAWHILARAAQQSSVDIAAGAARKLAEWGMNNNMPDPDEHIDPFIPMLIEAGIMPEV